MAAYSKIYNKHKSQKEKKTETIHTMNKVACSSLIMSLKINHRRLFKIVRNINHHSSKVRPEQDLNGKTATACNLMRSNIVHVSKNTVLCVK